MEEFRDKELDIQTWVIFLEELSVSFMSMAFIESFVAQPCSDISATGELRSLEGVVNPCI
jgi:hypothetical protein